MSNSGNKFMDDLANAYSEAAKRNADALKQGFDLIRESMSLPYDLSRIVAESNSTLSKGFADYMKLNIEHTSHLLDLSREMSKELMSALERSGWQTKASSAEQPRQAQTVSVLTMPGYPGDLCRSAFIIESKKSSPVLARVFHSRFIDLSSEASVIIPVIFDPVEVTVVPDEKVRVTVEAGIPENLPPGVYQSMVWIDGFPELSLKLIVKVYEAKQASNDQAEGNIKPEVKKQTKTRSKKK
jgi:hypothetical protein